MKIFLFLIILNCIFFNAFAQRRQNVYFLKNDGKEAQVQDSADYIRIIREPKEGKINYELIEYYPDSTIKTIGEVSSFDKESLILEGILTSYYKNGCKESIINYEKDKPVGTGRTFYSNGKPEEVRFYDQFSKDPIYNTYKTLQFYYEDGKPCLDENGDGYYKMVSNENTIVGNYKNGRKDGIWKELDLKNKTELEQEFINGVFKKGTFKPQKGKVLTYTVSEQLPSFRGGISNFYAFLSHEVTYPVESREKNRQGHVLVSFIINEDGSLNNFKIVLSISPDIDKEALRAVKQSPKWNPGIQNYKPVKVKLTVPVRFSLTAN